MENYFEFFENVNDIFSMEFKTADKIKDDCLYVLDTNILLVPYKLSGEDLDVITKVYKEILAKNRLFIPSTSIKEFAKKRPELLGDMYQAISQYSNSIQFKRFPRFKMFPDGGVYNEIEDMYKQIDEQIKKYREKFTVLLKEIKEYNWDDPVSKKYKELFNSDCIIDFELNDLDVESKWKDRCKFKIPPGYKDQGKSQGGMGDFYIWKEILELAKDKSKDIIFVTNETKPDWFHLSMKEPIYARYELLYEFKKYTDGKDIAILNLSEFIKLQGVEEKTIERIDNAIENDEDRSSDFYRKIFSDIDTKKLRSSSVNLLKKQNYNKINNSMKVYRCSNCGKRFIRDTYPVSKCPHCGAIND